MKHLLCGECARAKIQGYRLLGSRPGEPPEYERINWGIAAQPTLRQRTIRAGDFASSMDLRHYNCDSCNAPIKPGDRCCAHTAWLEGRAEPELWELEYLRL
jgi:hypothetical protein